MNKEEWKPIKGYDEIAEMLGVAKGTVFNYIRRFKIRKIYE